MHVSSDVTSDRLLIPGSVSLSVDGTRSAQGKTVQPPLLTRKSKLELNTG